MIRAPLATTCATFAEGRVHVALAPSSTLSPAPADTDTARSLPLWRRGEHLASRALLRRLLTGVVGPDAAALPIAARDTGRPHLPDHPDLVISLSHEGGWVAAAVGFGLDVGVDVQPPEPVNDGMLRRCCTPRAREALTAMSAAERDREFARIWAVQESCVKADGSGVGGLPWTVPVEVGQDEGVWRDYHWHRLPTDVPAGCAYREVR